nr:polysaccharide biosynthesis tyrosine autokinase [Pseudanabaena sp. FACHB-2040]
MQPAGEQEFGYGQLLGVLLRRWVWLAGSLSLAMAGAVYVASQQEPTYQSSMQLIVEPNFQQDLRSEDLTGIATTQVNETDYATQLTLMRSKQFIEEAVASLQEEYPELDPDSVARAYSLGRIKEDKNATRIFQATYVDDDPTRTQRVLQAMQAVYLRYNEERQEDRLNRGLNHVNEQLKRTRGNLQTAQSSLEQFRQGQNLLDPAVQGQAVVEALNQVQSEQRQLLADFSGVESRYQVLQQQLALSPQNAQLAARLSQSGRVQALLTSLQEANLALADRRIIFTDQDEEVQVLIEQRDNQLAELRQEISSIARRPVEDLDPTIQSLLQLGPIDLNLVGSLLEADSSLQSLQARWQSLTEMEELLLQELQRYPSLIAEYDRLQPNVEIERTTLQQLLEQREQLSSELARGGFTWEVIEQPQLGYQIGPDTTRPLALGVVAGLFVGGALAFVRESMDKVVRTSDDLKKQVPLPLLGILPTQVVRRGFAMPTLKRDQPPLPGSLHPELAGSELMQTILCPPFRDSLDLIANQIQLLQKDHVPKALAITSGLPGEGKTTLTLGLAISLSRMNQRVLVIDADLRRSGIQAQLGLALESGLSTLLSVGSGFNRPHRLDFSTTHIDILPAGPAPADPITLLSSPRFRNLIAKCKDHYDLVLIDTPPVLGMADALKVGAACDSTVLVTRLDRITQPELTEVLALLTPLEVLGIIANGAKSTSSRYTSYANQPYVAAP